MLSNSSQAFDIVVPSLPGFGFSSPAPNDWSTSDTATLFNTLMTQVLGYKSYAVHGTDWGSVVGFDMYDQFNTTVKAAHFNFLPFFPLTPEELAAQGITLTATEAVQEQRAVDFDNSGIGYYMEQSTTVRSIPCPPTSGWFANTITVVGEYRGPRFIRQPSWTIILDRREIYHL